MFNRRLFFVMVAGTAASRSFAVTAGQMRRVGWLTAQTAGSLAPYLDALRRGLAEQNLVEGEDIEVLYRYGDDQIDRVPVLAQDLVARSVELMIVQGAAVAKVLKLNLPVPIVYVTSADPIASGFARSLSESAKNATGVTFMAFELLGKRLEFLKEVIPSAARVTVLGNPLHPGSATERAASEEAGRRLDLGVEFIATPSQDALMEARMVLSRNRPDAISLLADGFAIAHRQMIMAMANDAKIPVISGWPVFAQAGALFTYGARLPSVYRRVAYYVARILGGANPGDLPVERPTQFELVLNQAAARSFGLTFSRAMVARADDVIG